MRHMLLAIIALAVTAAAHAQDAQVPYPSGYRNWEHVKSMVISPGHPLYDAFGGIHHIYANNKAVDGYRTGKFPIGSIIVMDVLEAGAADNALVEGRRKVLAVMMKDPSRYDATGGWGFEAFTGGNRATRTAGANAKAACFECHATREKADYVFSRRRN